MTSDVTMVIPTHVARMKNGMLERALRSVYAQTLQPDAISIAVDTLGEGAARTRQRALMAARTRYVAFLDSDDTLKPQHLKSLVDEALRLDAAYVFSWFEPVGMIDHVGHFGKAFDLHNPHLTTTTVLCRADIAQEIGFTPQSNAGSVLGDEDWRFVQDFCQVAIERDLRMVHLPERTWEYHYHGRNTSGLAHNGDGPERWK
jgi:glycosyltransferase involved in cell wall biosynthesis